MQIRRIQHRSDYALTLEPGERFGIRDDGCAQTVFARNSRSASPLEVRFDDGLYEEAREFVGQCLTAIDRIRPRDSFDQTPPFDHADEDQSSGWAR